MTFVVASIPPDLPLQQVTLPPPLFCHDYYDCFCSPKRKKKIINECRLTLHLIRSSPPSWIHAFRMLLELHWPYVLKLSHSILAPQRSASQSSDPVLQTEAPGSDKGFGSLLDVWGLLWRTGCEGNTGRGPNSFQSAKMMDRIFHSLPATPLCLRLTEDVPPTFYFCALWVTLAVCILGNLVGLKPTWFGGGCVCLR